MPSTLTRPGSFPGLPAPPPAGGSPVRPRPAARAFDLWPRTNRVLPWLIAAFLVMLWLVPFDSTDARVSFPVDLKLDRFLLTAMMVAWLASVFAGGRPSPRWNGGALDVAVLLFAGVATVSVLLNVGTLARLDEIELATKKIALLSSYVTFFFIVATTVRPEEVPRFMRLFLWLGAICAAGVVFQYFSGRNLFFEAWRAVVPDGAFAIRRVGGFTQFTAPPVTGPAIHALAVASMFAMALSFAVLELARRREVAAKLIYGGITALIVLGVFATSRKTGSFASLAALATITAYRPRQMMKLAPVVGLVLVSLIVLRPQAVERQVEQIRPSQISAGASGDARSSDYEAIGPDVRSHLVAGRGYGTYDHDKYRTLDNNYLLLLIETGVMGLGAFALMLIAVPLTTHRTIQRGDPARSTIAVAAVGCTAAFAAAMALFDALAFAQVPYLFFFTAAMAVAARVHAPAHGPALPAQQAEAVELPPLTQRLEESLPPLVQRADEALPPLVETPEQEQSAVRPAAEAREHLGERRLGRGRFSRGTGAAGGPGAGGEGRRFSRRRPEGPAGPQLPSRPPSEPAGDDAPAGPLPPLGAPRDEAPTESLPALPALPAEAETETEAVPAAQPQPAGATTPRRRRVRERAPSMVAGAVALGLAVLAFGRGGVSPLPGLPALSGGGASEDPFLSSLPEHREKRPSAPGPAGTPRRVAVSAPAQKRATRPQAAAPQRPKAHRPEPRDQAEPRKPRKPRKPSKPRAPEPAAPAAPVTPAPAPAPDCLPGDVEAVLVGLGLDPCGDGVSAADLERALTHERLSARDAARIEALLRRLATAAPAEAAAQAPVDDLREIAGL